jgi:hypothetical protein
VVVAVGLRLVEPLADVDVKVPGVMLMLVASVVSHAKVLLIPESTLAGFATKEVIVGRVPLFDDKAVAPPQFNNAEQKIRQNEATQRFNREGLRLLQALRSVFS